MTCLDLVETRLQDYSSVTGMLAYVIVTLADDSVEIVEAASDISCLFIDDCPHAASQTSIYRLCGFLSHPKCHGLYG